LLGTRKKENHYTLILCLKFVCVQPKHFRRVLYVSESYASSRWPESTSNNGGLN